MTEMVGVGVTDGVVDAVGSSGGTAPSITRMVNACGPVVSDHHTYKRSAYTISTCNALTNTC